MIILEPGFVFVFGALSGAIAVLLAQIALDGYEQSRPLRNCKVCGHTFLTVMSDDGLCYVVPTHGHPDHERVCSGSGDPGEAP